MIVIMKQIIFIRFTLFISVLSFIVFGFQNCSDVNFSTAVENSINSCSEDPDDPCHDITETLRKIQPAVAVRGISCLMCHAQIHANVITDFGFGSPWYWGGSKGINDASWYNNYVNTWQHAVTVVGSIIVPDAIVPVSVQNSVASFASLPPMTIRQLMTTPYVAPQNWGGNEPYEGHVEMSYKIAPASGEKVIAKSEIVISSPTEEEITALAPLLWESSGVAGFTRVGGTDEIQLIQKGSGSAVYTMNDGARELQCVRGNIVIKGSLYLRGLRVQASGGCRLYVSGSVFIEDGITYGSGVDQNLQITSANGIFMGVNVNRLEHRLIDDSRGLQITGVRTYEQRANQAMQEARNIGILRDALDDYGGARASVDYTGLLLNAPMIHSRYLGLIKGTIIAEAALFALGQFHFEFDPVFTRVNALPLMKRSILVVN